MLLLIAVFLLFFAGIEIPHLIKNKYWKELCLGSGTLILAIIYGLDFNFGWHITPNPDIVIKGLLPLTEAFEAFFHIHS